MLVLKPTEIINRATYSNSGNCIPLINCGGIIRSGDYVRYQVTNHHKMLLVGQIIAIADLEQIPRAERRACVDARGNGDDRMVLIRHFKFPRANSVARPNSANYPNISASLREVVQTNNLEWIRVANVRSIAFVFHIETINQGVNNCSGMRDAFFISHIMHGRKRK